MNNIIACKSVSGENMFTCTFEITGNFRKTN